MFIEYQFHVVIFIVNYFYLFIEADSRHIDLSYKICNQMVFSLFLFVYIFFILVLYKLRDQSLSLWHQHLIMCHVIYFKFVWRTIVMMDMIIVFFLYTVCCMNFLQNILEVF